MTSLFPRKWACLLMLAPLTLHAAKRPMPSTQPQQASTIKPASTKQLRGEVLFRTFLGDVLPLVLVGLGPVIHSLSSSENKTAFSGLFVGMPVTAVLYALTFYLLTSFGLIHRVFNLKLVKPSGAPASFVQRLLYPLWHSLLPILVTIFLAYIFYVYFNFKSTGDSRKFEIPFILIIMTAITFIVAVFWWITHLALDLGFLNTRPEKMTSTRITKTTLVSTV